MAELLKLRQDNFVPVTISGEHLHGTAHDNVGAVPASPSRKMSAEAGNCTTWVTSASALSSLLSRSLNKANCWRNCSRSDAFMLRSPYFEFYHLNAKYIPLFLHLLPRQNPCFHR